MLSEEEGIKAIIGKLRGKGTTEVQSYPFSKDKWRLERAPKSAHSKPVNLSFSIIAHIKRRGGYRGVYKRQ